MDEFNNDVRVNGTLTLNNSGRNVIIATDANGSPAVEIDGTRYTIPYYKEGDIFMSVTKQSPAERFGGDWEQLTGDAYFKIMSEGAGEYGGTSVQHKIPESSMPAHWGHTFFDARPENCYDNDPNLQQAYYIPLTLAESSFYKYHRGGFYRVAENEVAPSSVRAGGTSPYYPYYYGIYVWIKRPSRK